LCFRVRVGSGVARVLYALGQETFLRSLSTKTTEFEVKKKCKSAEEAKAKQLLSVFYSSFSGNKTHFALEINSTKLVIPVESRSNNSGIWGQSPLPQEATPPTLRRFLQFFFKEFAFLSTILWSKFA